MLICEQVALGEHHKAQVARLWLRMEWPKWALTAMNPVPVPRSGVGGSQTWRTRFPRGPCGRTCPWPRCKYEDGTRGMHGGAWMVTAARMWGADS